MSFATEVRLDAHLFDVLAAMLDAWYDRDTTDEAPQLLAEIDGYLHDLLRDLAHSLTELSVEAGAPAEHGRWSSPKPSTLRRYVNQHSESETDGRLDSEVRLMRGAWSGEPKVVVEFGPIGFSVFLTTWMAGPGPANEFTKFLQRRSTSIRDELRTLSAQLETRFGTPLELHYTSRFDSVHPNMRYWLDDDREWQLWTGNEQHQASVGVYVRVRSAEEFAQIATRSDVRSRTPFDTAGRIMGGKAGIAMRDAEGDLAKAVDDACDASERLFSELLDSGHLTELVYAAAIGLGRVLDRYWAYKEGSAVPSVRPVPWNTRSEELAELLIASYEKRGGTQLTMWHADGGIAVGVCEPDPSQPDQPPYVTIKQQARSSTFQFHVGKRINKGWARRPPVVRQNLRLVLDGPAGDDLLDLACMTGNALHFRCGPEHPSRCPVGSRQKLLTHWLPGQNPIIRWRLTKQGDADWAAKPLALMAELLGQWENDPPELVIPSVGYQTWDVFVSTRGSLGEMAAKLTDGLTEEGVDAWYMDHHQQIGANIRDNMLTGLNASTNVLMLLDDGYFGSVFCAEEFVAAVSAGKPLAPIFVPSLHAVQASGARIRDSLDRQLETLKTRDNLAVRVREQIEMILAGDIVIHAELAPGKAPDRVTSDLARQFRLKSGE